MNKKINVYIKYAIPFVVTMLLGLLILAIRGIYPFGSETVDYYDLSTQVTAFYYHIYDALHGTKSFYFDWYSALGSNMTSSAAGCSYFSIFNLLFLFIDRAHILESLSWFLVIKMGFMSLSMYFCVHKAFKAPDFIEQIVSIGYGFCGFALMNSSFMCWFDYAILVPLILYFAFLLVRVGKSLGFIITLTMGLIVNYYLTFMTLFFIFLEVGLYFFIYSFKRKPEESHPYINIIKLGLSVVLSFGLSSFVIIPQILQSISSSRASNGGISNGILSFYTEILKQYNGGFASRWWVLLGLSFAGTICVLGVIHDLKLKNWRRLLMVIGSLLMVCLSLVFENVDLFWHFGSYVQYPMRYGFLIYLSFAFSACYYSSELFQNENQVSFVQNTWLLFSFIITPALIIAGNKLHNSLSRQPYTEILHATFYFIGFTFVTYLVLSIIKKGRYLKLSLCIWIAEIVVYGILTIGNQTYITGYNEDPEQERDSVRICRQLSEQLDLENDFTERIKNPDESLNANYGFYLANASLSNWTHLVPQSLQNSLGNLGYSFQYTRLLDAGGTVFTDAILHVTRILSTVSQDESLYAKTNHANVIIDHISGEVGDYYLYNCLYKLPFVLPISDEGISEINSAGDMVMLHNALYDGICPDELNASQSNDTFAEYLASNPKDWKTDTEYDLNIEGHKALYFTGNCPDSDAMNIEILVNGTAVSIPSIREEKNTLYPAHFNNNVVYLGSFDSENVDILFKSSTGEKPTYVLSLFTVDLDMLKNLCDWYSSPSNYNCKYVAKNSSFSFDVSCNKSGHENYYLVPIAYSSGWHLGKNSDGYDIGNLRNCFSLISTPTESYNNTKEKDINSVLIKFTSSGLSLGIISSILSVLILIVYLFFVEPASTSKNVLYKKAVRVIGILYISVWSIVILLMFVIPVAYGCLCYLHIL